MTTKENEKAADAFDMRLYSLVLEAADRAESGRFCEQWRKVWMALLDARPTVRGMMDKKKRAETS